MRKFSLFLALLLSVPLVGYAQEPDLLASGQLGKPIILKGEIDEFTIDATGEYILEGVVKGNINFSLGPNDRVLLRGKGKHSVLQGIPRVKKKANGETRKKNGKAKKEERHVSHIQASGKDLPAGAMVGLRDFKIKGHRQNAMKLGGKAEKLVRNVNVVNHTRRIGGHRQYGAGGINAGENSSVEGCRLKTGDDAIKLTEPYSFASDLDIELRGNGTAIQLGWGKRGNGAYHVAQDIRVSGWTDANTGNDSNRAGRSIIGGVFRGKREVSNIQITGLRVKGNRWGHVIKIIADRGAVIDGVVIKGRLLDGIRNASARNKAIVLIARRGGKIKNVVIDLGDEAAKKKYHHIEGVADNQISFVRRSRK
jgi:hypothetical protein